MVALKSERSRRDEREKVRASGKDKYATAIKEQTQI